MSSQFHKIILIAIIFVFVSSGCATAVQPTPTATFIPTVTLTPTNIPTNTPIPTSTKLPPCDADQTIKNLKSKIVFDEFVVLHNKLQGKSFLVVWFVDSEINPTPKVSEISQNAELAIRKSLILSQELNASDACVGRLFDMINAIAVDKNYNGWFSGQIKTTDLPSTITTDEQQLDEISKLYEIGYLRDKMTAQPKSMPSGKCTWIEARENLHNHFSSERENVGFYFVLDDAGVNVWAQWDSKPEFLQLNLPASLLNIGMEIECLFPQPDRLIFYTVDDNGEIQIAGMWNWGDIKSQNIGQVQVLYQK